jgi:alanine racemase
MGKSMVEVEENVARVEKGYYRNTWVEVDLDAIQKNVCAFREHLPKETAIMAVVKADGYGHGATPVAKEALEAGATYLAVAFLDEALRLRKDGIKAPILILGYTAPEFVAAAVQHEITLTVFHEDVLLAVEMAAKEAGLKGKVHFKVDTGMGRIGVKTRSEFDYLYKLACSYEHVYVEGAFTHFSCADSYDSAYTLMQHHNFIEIIQSFDIPIVHCCNSAAGILFPQWGYDMIRLGICLYGQYPSEFTKGKGIELVPAFSLKSQIAHVKKVPSGTSISYGATFTTPIETWIASVPIGYADGFSRSLSNKGKAIVGGEIVPIVGRVCMDQLMLDVTIVNQPKIGDEVVFIGKQGGAFISVDNMADWLSTINYEVTCMIGKRVPRVYIKGGKIVMTNNSLL